MKKLIYLLILCFVTSSIFGQNESKKEIIQIDADNQKAQDMIEVDIEQTLKLSTTALKKAQKNNYIKGQVWALFAKTVYYETTYKYQKAMIEADKALYLSHLDTMKYDKAKLYYIKGSLLSRLGEIDSVFIFLDSAKQHLTYSNPVLKAGLNYRIHYTLGRTYERIGELDKAMEAYIESMKIGKINNEKRFQAEALFNLGYVCETQNKSKQALKYYQDGFLISKEAKDTTFIVYNGVYVASMYMQMGENKRALPYLKETLKLAELQKNEESIGFVYFEMANYYRSENDLEKTIFYLLKSREIDENLNNSEGIIASYIETATTYLKFEKYDLATQEAQKGIEITQQANARLYLKDFYLLISQIAEKKNNINKAFEYYKLYTDLKDSIFNEESVEKFNELQTKYETEKKEQQIKDLENQKTIDNLENKNKISSLQAQISILGLILLAPISLLIGGGWYVNRRRLHLKLEAEQKERAKQMSELKALRSQMNPHFIFNALNSIQDFIMLSEKENATLYLGKFATLMRGFLDSSSKEKTTLEKELPLIESYIELEGLRLGEDFSYEVHFDKKIDTDELEDIEIPPLLIQPYLENAFKHGLIHKTGEKKLTLEFNKIEKVEKNNANFIQLKITDNGIGRQKSAEINARKAKTHQSFATQATEERLELMKNQSNSNATIEVKINDLKDNQGNAKGTEIVILIPLNND